MLTSLIRFSLADTQLDKQGQGTPPEPSTRSQEVASSTALQHTDDPFAFHPGHFHFFHWHF